MKAIKFGTDDSTHSELNDIAADKKMSFLNLMGYVVGTFLWVMRHVTKDHMIVALDEGGEVVGVLNIWEEDENGA